MLNRWLSVGIFLLEIFWEDGMEKAVILQSLAAEISGSSPGVLWHLMFRKMFRCSSI